MKFSLTPDDYQVLTVTSPGLPAPPDSVQRVLKSALTVTVTNSAANSAPARIRRWIACDWDEALSLQQWLGQMITNTNDRGLLSESQIRSQIRILIGQAMTRADVNSGADRSG